MVGYAGSTGPEQVACPRRFYRAHYGGTDSTSCALCVAGVYKATYGKPAVAAVHAPGAPVAVEQNEGGPGPFWWMSGSAPQVQQKPAGVELEHDAQRSKWSKGIPALA